MLTGFEQETTVIDATMLRRFDPVARKGTSDLVDPVISVKDSGDKPSAFKAA